MSVDDKDRPPPTGWREARLSVALLEPVIIAKATSQSVRGDLWLLLARFGLLCRHLTAAEARVALARYPDNPSTAVTHMLASMCAPPAEATVYRTGKPPVIVIRQTHNAAWPISKGELALEAMGELWLEERRQRKIGLVERSSNARRVPPRGPRKKL